MIRRKWRWWLAGTAALVVAASLAMWLWWPRTPPPRARPYLAFTACLLTDDQGLTGPSARRIWQGMQDASLATHAKVEYLPVNGPATTDNARPYLASLIQRQCNVVLAVGDAQITAVNTTASNYPHTHFVTVGANGTNASNVTALTATSPATLQHQTKDLVVALVHAANNG